MCLYTVEHVHAAVVSSGCIETPIATPLQLGLAEATCTLDLCIVDRFCVVSLAAHHEPNDDR